MSTTSLKISKQNLKFSAAHFLIFDSTRAERLHGHNYQVQLEVFAEGSDQLSKQGFLIDFHDIKKISHALIQEWDEVVLLPGKNSEFKFSKQGNHLEVIFRDRSYRFPENEVVLLPIINTSVELLAQCLAEKLMTALRSKGVTDLVLQVEETLGQGAIYSTRPK